MSGLESAASLFGSDNSNDPFATLGTNGSEDSSAQSTETLQHSSNDDLFGSADSSQADFLFDNTTSTEQSGTLQTEAGSSYYDTWPSNPAPEPSAYASAGSVGYGTQGWTGQTQNTYDPGHTPSNATYNASYTPPITTYTPSNTNYTPSNANYTPSNTYNTYAPPATSSTSNSYDPYAPPQVPSHQEPSPSPYAPQNPAPAVPLSQTSSYTPNSYAPTVSNSNYGTPSYAAASPYAAESQPLTPVPPPPAPKAAPVNRPKVSNAYDPPFPVAGSNRRAAPRSTSSLTSAYSAYGSPPPPQQTPPPAAPYYGQQSNAAAYYSHPEVGSHGYQSNGINHHPPPVHNGATSPYASPPVRQPTQDLSYARPPLSNGYQPPSVVSHPPPPPRPPSQSLHNHVVNRTGTPRTQSPLSRTASPAVVAQPPPPRNDSIHSSTSPPPPPPPMGISRMSSPASVRSQKVHSPSTSSATSVGPSAQQSTFGSSEFRSASPAGFTNSYDPYPPTSENVVNDEAISPSSSQAVVEENPYLPKKQTTMPPVPSQPSSFTGISPTSVDNQNPYLPKKSGAPAPPVRSMSNGSLLSENGAASDPYAPSIRVRRQTSEAEYGSYTSRYDYPNNELSVNPPPITSSYSLGPTQELVAKAPTHTLYAPSPSLLGTNDPLGRTSARVPVFSFGFGGKIVTCFHGADTMSTGFDVALASRNSTGIQIRVLNKIVPESALDLSPSSFPGPLFSDPGSPTTGLVRPGASTQVKNKKTRLIKYLDDRAEEIAQGLGYLHAGSAEKRHAEGKLILVKLLKIMVEYDGKLMGTPQAEAAVRNALVPELELRTDGTEAESFTTAMNFSSVGEDGLLKSHLPGSDASESSVVLSSLRPSSLDKIQDFLLRGEKRKAYHYALDQKLWAHAMVIASGIDREAWKEVVNEFLRSELGSKNLASRTGTYGQQTSGTTNSSVNGREGLRVAYSLFSGQGAAAVQELVPQNSMSAPQQQARLPVPTVSHTTPMTPNFAAPAPVANIPPESLAKWSEMVAMMFSGSMSQDSSSALTALADQLCGNQWIEAGHACYLLASQASHTGGFGAFATRVTLLGAPSPNTSTRYIRDTDAIIFSEILEFALGLAPPPPKGQEPFHGLPHLQAYRLVRAMFLAEIGEISLANRYCEAINASMNRNSPYFTTVLQDQLRNLSDRISGTAHSDKAGSWMGNKIGKPSLDSIGGWLEGRFTKLVTGDSDDNGTERNEAKAQEHGFVGPFSHYSAISSTASSASPSPQSSVVNLNAYAPTHTTAAYAPKRTGSSMSNRSFLGNPPSAPQERAASAMDYGPRRKASPGPKVASASASTTTFAQSQSFGQAFSPYSPPGTAKQDDIGRRSSDDIKEEDEGQEVTWWGADNGRTPTTATFVKLDDNPLASSSDGFISLMDTTSQYSYQPQVSSRLQHSTFEDEDEEDLGFGNSKKPRSSSPERERGDAGESKDTATKPANKAAPSAPQRPDPTPAQAAAAGASSGSWLSKWWKRDSTPGPVKANLGEEKSFYYDAELKRWVNKAAESKEAPKPASAPPPPRAQTASPGMSGPRPPSAGPPPARSASVADMSGPPRGPPPGGSMRIRSNLVPTEDGGPGSGSVSVPSTPVPGSSGLAPPSGPPSRPRSQASTKKNVRSRYVDVFQQEGGAA